MTLARQWGDLTGGRPLSEHIEGAPEAYFGAMRIPCPAVVV
ncbi:hypothetical protein [Streptosporangium roseum]